MVEQNFIFRIVKELEHYLIALNNYTFNGSGYATILFIPVTRHNERVKFNIILSASEFDRYSRKKTISEIYDWLRNKIGEESSARIESLIIVNSNSPFVRKINFIIPYQDEIRELVDIEIGGVKIYRGFLISTNISKNLMINSAVTATLDDNQVINMGIKYIDENLVIEYYTGQGLRELFPRDGDKAKLDKATKLKKKGDEFLYKNQYLAKIPLSKIRSLK